MPNCREQCYGRQAHGVLRVSGGLKVRSQMIRKPMCRGRGTAKSGTSRFFPVAREAVRKTLLSVAFIGTWLPVPGLPTPFMTEFCHVYRTSCTICVQLSRGRIGSRRVRGD